MGGDPQAIGAERSHRAPPAGHSRSAPVSWVLATASWITTVDHKRIGILYGVTAFAFFLLGGLEALLIRLQLAAPDADRKSTRLNSSHGYISYAVFCLIKKAHV